MLVETAYSHKSNKKKYDYMIGGYIKDLLSPGYSVSAFEYIKGIKNKEKVKRNFEEIFKVIDIMATPTLPIIPQKLEVTNIDIKGYKEKVIDSMTRFVQVFNLTEQPALSIPCGITKDELPVGLQLIARTYEENLLIRTGYLYEQNYLKEFYSERNFICQTDLENLL